MCFTSETYNKIYSKSANLSHSFDNLRSNIYVPFLLLIITLRFTSGKRKFWLMIKKFQNSMVTVAGSEMALMAKNICFKSLDHEIRIHFSSTI